MPGALVGILGIVIGNVVFAIVSASSLGIILSTSSVAYAAIRYVGAAYLFYLGVRSWRLPVEAPGSAHALQTMRRNLFFKALMLQLTNPGAIFFFMSVFPQFVDFSTAYQWQFVRLMTTFGILVVIIHGSYALLARSAHAWLGNPRIRRVVGKLSGLAFVAFAVTLATKNR